MTGQARHVAYVSGIALWAPRLPGWDLAREVLSGRASAPDTEMRRPAPELLPATERRRAPDTVALAVEVATRACSAAAVDPTRLASVFASTHGDLGITNYMCETLARTPLQVSPTRFHNSVHNAPAGYWCVATGCRAPYSSVSAYEYSFAHGLLESLAQTLCDMEPILFVAYDIEASGPLATIVTSRGMLGLALVLSPLQGEQSSCRLDWSLRQGDPGLATRANSPGAELLGTNSMAPGLPLFEAFARGAGTVSIGASPGTVLDLEVTPISAGNSA